MAEIAVECVDSIITLRSLAKPLNDACIMVLGYNKPGDGGGGHFFWDPVDKENDNGGTIILPNNESKKTPGRWRRLVDGPISVKWFGVNKEEDYVLQSPPQKAAGKFKRPHALEELEIEKKMMKNEEIARRAKKNDAAIKEALSFATKINREVYFPRGTILVNQPIDISSCKIRGEFVTWYGAGLNSTVIKAGPGFESERGNNAVLFSKGAPCQLMDLMVDAKIDETDACEYAVCLFQANGPLTLVSNVMALNAKGRKGYGFYFQKCQGATMERLWAQFNNIGIVAEDCNASRFINCRVEISRSHGMWVKKANYSAGCRIDNLLSELNCGHGLLAQGVSYLQAKNCWMEENRDDGIRLEECLHAVIEGARISENQSRVYYNRIPDINDNPQKRHLKQFRDFLNNKIKSGGDEKNDRCIRLIYCKKCKVFNCSAGKIKHAEYLSISEVNNIHPAGNDLEENNWKMGTNVENGKLDPESLFVDMNTIFLPPK